MSQLDPETGTPLKAPICGPYVPAIRADFGRTITDKEINDEFDAIESMMECVCEQAGGESKVIDNAIDLGTVATSTTILPSNGRLQYMSVEGDVDITVADPADQDSLLLTLVIADGGSGRFNLPNGLAWTSDSNDGGMDGKPWDNDGLGGDYGAIVTCIHDGTGWVFMVFARNDIDPDDVPDVADLYNWR